MPTIGRLDAILALQSASFIRDLNKASQATATATTQMSRNFSKLNAGLTSATAGLKTFVAGFAGLSGLRFLQDIVQTADEIGDTASRLGVAAEELQRFRFAAEQAGVGMGELDAALTKFQRNIAEGKINLGGGSLAEQFTKFIDRVANAPTQIQQVQIAQQGLNKQFGVALAIAREGPDAFRQWYESAAVFSAQALETADRLDKQFREFRELLTVSFGTGFLEGLNKDLALTQDQVKAISSDLRQFGRDVAGFITSIASAYASLLTFAKQFRAEQAAIAAHTATTEAVTRGVKGMAIGGTSTPGSRQGPFAPGGAVGAGLEEATQAQIAFGEATDKAISKIGEWSTTIDAADVPERIKEWSSAFQSFGDSVANSLADAIVEGKEFGDVLTDLTKQLEKMFLSTAFHQIFAAILGNVTTPAATGTTAGAGLLGALFGHSGGVAGAGISKRLYPAGLFDGAPRLHNGLRAGEFPAILQHGEKVTPRGVNDNVTVNVYAPPGSQVDQQQRRDNSGLTIDVMIDQVDKGLALRASQGRSALGKTMERRNGLNPAAGAL